MPARKRKLKWWEKLYEDFARTRAGGWLAVHVANPIDQRLLERTNGRIGVYFGQQVGLLYSTGARSGERRTTPLLYLRDGERIVLIASKAGATRHPAWYHNLKAHPDVEFLPRGGPRGRYRAREAQGAERQELWRAANDAYAGYDDYQGRTGGRVIPVVVLEPVEDAPPTGASA